MTKICSFPFSLPYLWLIYDLIYPIYDLAKNLIPYSWPDTLLVTKMAAKWLKSMPYLWPKRLKNHTLSGRTYIYSPNIGVPPPPTSGRGHTVIFKWHCSFLKPPEKLPIENMLVNARGGVLPSNGLLGDVPLDGVAFHDSTDYNGVIFSSIFNRVTRMGSHFFGTLRVRKLFAQKWLRCGL